MSRQLISRSPDLARLQNDGLEISIDSGYLAVSNIPYVTSSKGIGYGSLAIQLTLSGEKTTKPKTHVVHFTGEAPCNRDGTPIRAIEHSVTVQQLTQKLKSQRTFSNKPSGGYADYYHLISRYVQILSEPAMSLDSQATPHTFKVIQDEVDKSPFVYTDTNSSRAGINPASEKLSGLRIGIVGLGGTGSYILDQVAKTPVLEIHLYDDDSFLQHNAFRSPGAPTIEELNAKSKKVDHFHKLYSSMHNGIHPHPDRIGPSNVGELEDLDFVFVCVDRGSARKLIMNRLEKADTRFIDVGIGVQLINDGLIATVRSTSSVPGMREHLKKRISFEDPIDDAYSSNIQISELNMLNAAMAVIKWKKLVGFYHDSEFEHHSTYTLNVNQLLSEDHLS